MAFAKDVKSLTLQIQDQKNPFGENNSDLLVLDSKNIVATAVADILLNTVKNLYELYVSERLDLTY